MTLVYATRGMELPHGKADGMKRFGDMFGFGMSVLGRLCSRAAKCLSEERLRKQVDLKF